MQLCEEKGCWLKDLEDVPSEELVYWISYYEIKDKEFKKQQKRAEQEARSRMGR